MVLVLTDGRVTSGLHQNTLQVPVSELATALRFSAPCWLALMGRGTACPPKQARTREQRTGHLPTPTLFPLCGPLPMLVDLGSRPASLRWPVL